MKNKTWSQFKEEKKTLLFIWKRLFVKIEFKFEDQVTYWKYTVVSRNTPQAHIHMISTKQVEEIIRIN